MKSVWIAWARVRARVCVHHTSMCVSVATRTFSEHTSISGAAYNSPSLPRPSSPLLNRYVFPWTAGTPFASEDPGPSGKKGASTDGGGMPLILTNAAADTLVMSPLEDFFTSTQGRSEQLLGNVSLGLQVMGV